MQSPIPNSFWANMFKVAAVTTVGLSLLSLYNEKVSAGYLPIKDQLKTLKSRQMDYDAAIEALRGILDALDQETRQKKAAVKLYVRGSSVAGLLVKLLKYDSEAAEESAQLCQLIFRIVAKAFAADPLGRDAWHAAGGHKKLLALVSVAHREGHAKLLDEASQSLREVSVVDEAEMSLPTDIPEGSKGALALSQFPATVKMLRILDKNARIGFLVHITSAMASMCTIRAGGIAFAKGIDGRSGPSFFFELIDPRGNQLLTENCVRAIHWMSIHAKDTHEELADQANVVKLVDLVEPMQTTPTLHSLLGVFASMAYHAHSKKFLTEFMAANGPTALIRLWCKADEKETRERAETIVRLLMRNPQCTDEISRLLEIHRSMLMERRARDEEAHRKQMMERQRQQMMQQQMMMQMAQSGHMPPGMMGGDDE